MQTLIVTKNICKIYRMGDVEVNALRGVSLEIGTGEFVAIMGASGSGKSTFMNIIGCLDRPSSGDYLLNGENVSDMTGDQLAEVRNRKIGFIFQSFNILPRTSAIENVELPLLYNPKIGNDVRRERAFNALKLVGLADKIYSLPQQLSGGQQQRVAIARALVNEPLVILADEPTGNLDSRNSYEIMEVFQSLNEQGRTIVMVTHEPDIAQCAKRKVVFRDGQIILNVAISDRTNAYNEKLKIPDQKSL